MRGFDFSAQAEEQKWEEKARAIPDAARIGELIKRLSSQPHLAAAHALGLFPGLDQVVTLVGPAGDVDALLPALARRRAWTHVLLGEVWTPAPKSGDRFLANWQVRVRG